VRSGVDVETAVVESGKARFRPVLLTSITTIAGLLPILLERSFQAQFLIPMAISICFGLLAATVLTLLYVPALYLIVRDVRNAVVVRILRVGARSQKTAGERQMSVDSDPIAEARK
jgi:Cu/Ag efflux pump CusA